MKVGITGGIGAGKSTVAKIFQILGVPVYNADNEAKLIMHNNLELKQQIIGLLGAKAYFENGTLNRVYLAEQVFNKVEELRKLNALVHPKVAEHFHNWHHEKIAQGNKYTLKEAALLFETGSYRELDHTILVSAAEAVRVGRVLKRDKHRTIEQVTAIIEKQMPETEKQTLANSFIQNDGTALIIPKVLEIHQRLLAMA